MCTMTGVSRINVTQRLAHKLPQSNVKVRVGKSLVTSSKSGSGDFQVHDFVRQHIVDLEPYTPILPFEVLSGILHSSGTWIFTNLYAEKLGLPCDKIVKLDANENPYGPPPGMLFSSGVFLTQFASEVYTALQNLQYPHIYPDPESRQLRAALVSNSQRTKLFAQPYVCHAGGRVWRPCRKFADWLRRRRGNISLCACFSQSCMFFHVFYSQLIDLLMRVVLEPGDKIINTPPTFGMYSFDCSINGSYNYIQSIASHDIELDGRVIDVRRGPAPNFQLDVEGIEKAVFEHQPKLLFLTSPNNPDGSLIDDQILERLLKLPVLVVLDEAYIEFSSSSRSYISQVTSHQNLIVLRTFSKRAALAGM